MADRICWSTSGTRRFRRATVVRVVTSGPTMRWLAASLVLLTFATPATSQDIKGRDGGIEYTISVTPVFVPGARMVQLSSKSTTTPDVYYNVNYYFGGTDGRVAHLLRSDVPGSPMRPIQVPLVLPLENGVALLPVQPPGTSTVVSIRLRLRPDGTATAELVRR